MKISTKGRYALRLMIDLAQQPKEIPTPLKDISERQDISIKYLEQIVSALCRAGLIHSVRGAMGGYLLNREPNEYTAKEIIEAAEGPISCVSCLEGNANHCKHYEECRTVSFYENLNDVIISFLSDYTLQDFLDNASK